MEKARLNEKSMSQEDLVLRYLKTHKEGITSLQALERFGIMQMPKRAFTLRKRGYNIKSTPKVVKNRYGKKVNIVVYTLEGAA